MAICARTKKNITMFSVYKSRGFFPFGDGRLSLQAVFAFATVHNPTGSLDLGVALDLFSFFSPLNLSYSMGPFELLPNL